MFNLHLAKTHCFRVTSIVPGRSKRDIERETIERQVEVHNYMIVSFGQSWVFAIFVLVFVFFLCFFFTPSLVEVSFEYSLTRYLVVLKCKSAAEGH